VSAAASIVAAAVALACPLRMLWRMRRGRRVRCGPAADDAAAAVRARPRALAERIASLARRESAWERH
jgi:hypothetical protein